MDATMSTAEVIAAYAQAMRDGDAATIFSLYDDDITVHYAGDNPLSGAHRGKPAMLAAMAEIRRRTSRKLLELVDVMVGQDHGCIILRERFERDGEAHVMDRIGVYAVANGRIIDCRVHDADQALMDRLLRD